jgi:hypothetical protein
MKRKRNDKMETKETTTESGIGVDVKAFTDALKAQVKAAGGTKAFYEQNDIIKELTRGTFQAMLDAEMEEHLGYAPNDRESRFAVTLGRLRSIPREIGMERLSRS